MKKKIIQLIIIIFTISILITYFSSLTKYSSDSRINSNNKTTISTTKVISSETQVSSTETTNTTLTSSTNTSKNSVNTQKNNSKKSTSATSRINSSTTRIEEKSVSEFEDYIIRVVACEMPALYNKEALKAQAIAARTYALYQKSVGKNYLSKEDQCYLTDSEMKSKWGSGYDKYYKLISDAVLETESLIMKKDNKLFKSYYFSTSNGYTEDSQNVFREGELKSVESSWDKSSKNYLYKIEYTKDDIVSRLGIFDNIKINKRNITNHVEEVIVDDKTYTGVDFRHLLGLRSTDFDIEVINDKYVITTKGYGHGVGMSQYGANELAKQGKDYKYILKYYYGDIVILNS